MTRLETISITPAKRFEVGCIATLSDGIARHFAGSGRDATRAVADYCDAHDLKVVVLSTPASIYRDLAGHRQSEKESTSGTLSGVTRGDELLLPEPIMLGQIGRLDLLAEEAGG